MNYSRKQSSSYVSSYDSANIWTDNDVCALHMTSLVSVKWLVILLCALYQLRVRPVANLCHSRINSLRNRWIHWAIDNIGRLYILQYRISLFHKNVGMCLSFIRTLLFQQNGRRQIHDGQNIFLYRDKVCTVKFWMFLKQNGYFTLSQKNYTDNTT